MQTVLQSSSDTNASGGAAKSSVRPFSSDSADEKTANLPTVVVGCGLSGLACANALHNAGLPVIVLEARDSIGGRAKTVNFGPKHTPLDLGCSWIHGDIPKAGSTEKNPLAEFLRRTSPDTLAKAPLF